MREILTLISPLELFLFKIVSGQLMPDTTIGVALSLNSESQTEEQSFEY